MTLHFVMSSVPQKTPLVMNPNDHKSNPPYPTKYKAQGILAIKKKQVNLLQELKNRCTVLR